VRFKAHRSSQRYLAEPGHRLVAVGRMVAISRSDNIVNGSTSLNSLFSTGKVPKFVKDCDEQAASSKHKKNGMVQMKVTLLI